MDIMSLLSCIWSDGTIDVSQALQSLNDDDDDEECHLDEPSLLECVTQEGQLDVTLFFKRQEKLSLLEWSIMKESGLIDNGGSPTGSEVSFKAPRPFMHRNSRSILYKVFEGDKRRPATPLDSNWWKMYVEYPMLNIPKFYRCFCHRFRIPYDQFIQFIADAEEKNWFTHWRKHNSKSPIELLILGCFRYLG
jgi:hypothetical protein